MLFKNLRSQVLISALFKIQVLWDVKQWRTEGGFKLPPPEIPKALQNRAKLNPIVKTVKNC
jgi:hypothetical protein